MHSVAYNVQVIGSVSASLGSGNLLNIGNNIGWT